MSYLHQTFKNLKEVNPPTGLSGVIFASIEREKNQWLRLELFISRLGFAGSLFALIYTSWVFGQVIIKSEFWRIASLLASDLGIVAQNWEEFSYSLLETMPVVSITAILIPLFSMVLSIYFYSNLISKDEHKKIHSI